MRTKCIDHSRQLTIAAAAVVVFCLAGLLSACSVNKAVQAGMTDSQVTAGVETLLAADSRFDPYSLSVKTTEGRVRLGGIVGTMDDRDTAERIAKASRGVDSVDNYIRFDPTLVEAAAQ